MFALSIAGGQCLASVDVCNVPTPAGPVATPFPNSGMPQLGTPPSDKVLLSGMPALNKSAKIPLSNGDQAGTAGGVTSATIMGQVEFVQGSTKVRIDGAAAVRLGDATKHNNGNALGSILAPSQTKVMVMS